MYGPFQVCASLKEILPRWEVRMKSLQPIGKYWVLADLLNSALDKRNCLCRLSSASRRIRREKFDCWLTDDCSFKLSGWLRIAW